MKRYLMRIMTVLLLSVSLLLLVACGGNEGGDGVGEDTPDTAVTVYSPDLAPTVLTGSGAPVSVLETAGSLANGLEALLGRTVGRAVDTVDPAPGEIAVGETSRPASVYAYEYLAQNSSGEEYFSFVITLREGTLAVAASCDEGMLLAVEYLLGELCTGESLTLDEGYILFYETTEEQFDAEAIAALKEAELEGWEDRWQECTDILGEETTASLRRLYAIFGEEIYAWMANLYDPQTGAFYYAISSRDNRPFLPDVESTYQVINAIRASGMLNIYAEYYGCETTEALRYAIPEDIRLGIISFVQELQSEEDGYFYHPQWGTGIGTSRRGRDIRWATQLLLWLGGEPKYPTALDRLEGSTDPVAAISGMLQHTSTVAPAGYLSSEEEFRAYLDGLNFAKDSHSVGHSLASQMYEIEAAGLLDYLLDYTDALQEKNYLEMKAAYEADPESNPAPNGLWQKEINYTSISGLMKLSAIYNLAKRPVRYLDECVTSCIESALSDTDPAWVIYIYNPWAALGSVMSLARSSAHKAPAGLDGYDFDLDAAYEKIYASAADMIDATIVKLLKFRQADLAYSYYQYGSAPNTQGTYVSLGLPEGDVNATYCAFQTISYIFSAFNIDRPAVWSATDLDVFLDIVTTSSPIVKNELEPKLEYDFDDCLPGELPDGVISDSVTSMTAVDPKDPDNVVFASTSETTDKGNTTTVNVYSGLGRVSCIILEADLMMKSTTGGYSHQIWLEAPNISAENRLYMLTLNASGGYVTVGDGSSVTSSSINTAFDARVAVGEWFRLRLEIYTGDEADGFAAVAYVDGEYAGLSRNFYGAEAEGAEPKGELGHIRIYSMMRVASELLVDDLSVEYLTDRKFDPSTLPTVTGSYDFEEDEPGFSFSTYYPDSVGAVIDDPTGSGRGKVLSVTKTNASTGYSADRYRFESAGEKGSHFKVSLDVYFDSAELSEPNAGFRHLYQISVGEFNTGATVYTLFFLYGNDGRITLGDTNDTSKNSITTSFDFVFETDRWYRLELDIVSGSASDFLATVSVDGAAVGTSQNFYKNGTDGAVPSTAFTAVDIRPTRRALLLTYFDNVRIFPAE